ncbi:hypothetical protein N9H39_04695 [Gammaproteobacteria bacterium]|nr:hypothetical protein [Gammaproteobacteria bacterium]
MGNSYSRYSGEACAGLDPVAGIQRWSKEKTGITVLLFAMDTGMRRYDICIGLLRHPRRERELAEQRIL